MYLKYQIILMQNAAILITLLESLIHHIASPMFRLEY